MGINPLPSPFAFPYNFAGVPNVVPFAVSPGTSYLELLELYRKYIVKLVPEFEGNVNKIYDEMKAFANNLEGWTESKYAEFVQRITELVAAINNRVGPVDVQHLTGDAAIVIDPNWPNNHIIWYEHTQTRDGDGAVSVPAGVIGLPDIDPSPNAVSRFMLFPNGIGGYLVLNPNDWAEWGYKADRSFKAVLDKDYVNVNELYYNVQDFGAKADGVTDSAAAIQACIDAAAGKGRVWFPPGEYAFKAPLRLPGNTYIEGEGATLHRKAGGYQFFVNWFPLDNFGFYDGHSNIKIKGLVLDAHGGESGQNGSNMLTFNHAANIVVEDVTFRRCQRYHALEFNSVDNGVARNCVFEGWYDQDGNGGTKEAIQIDYAGPMVDSGRTDNTMSRNIVVESCTMRAYGEMKPHGILVGGHSGAAGGYYYGIRVVNNYCDGAIQSAIRPYQWRNSVIEGNVLLNSGGSGIIASGSSFLSITGNQIAGCGGYGIYLYDSPFSKIRGNSVDTVGLEGVTVSGESISCTVDGNTVRSSQSYGIAIVNGSNNCTVNSNFVQGAGANGTAFGSIRVSGASLKVSIFGNTVRMRSTSQEALAGISLNADTEGSTWVYGNNLRGMPAGVVGTFLSDSNQI